MSYLNKVKSIPVPRKGDTQEIPVIEHVENALKPQVGDKAADPAPLNSLKWQPPRPNRGGERETEMDSK